MKLITMFFLVMFSFHFTFAQQSGESTVISESAKIHSEANPSSPVKGHIKKGRRVKTFGQTGEFYKIKLKNGQTGYIAAGDLEAAELEVEGSDAPVTEAQDDFKRWNIQVNGSTGSTTTTTNGTTTTYTYTEARFGVGYFFYRWLEFHNAVFGRFVQPENVYGLDSSLRAVLNTDLGGIGSLNLFGGPGYRFATDADVSALFTELGAVASVAGISLGGSVRTFYYQMRDGSRSNENQYSIILSGSTVF